MVAGNEFWKIVCCTIVVVFQFDGSLRPPRDSGFPTLTSRMATCASCVGVLSQDDDGNTKESLPLVPVAVGSCFLPIPVDMTSAHAEYEGLLLGLDWLCEEMPSRLRQKDTGGPPSNILLIQGDCKTVIDQLSGKSLSRKLQVWHRQALERLNRLQGIFDKMEFEHIPRSQNSVCDNLCANLMHAAASTSWKNCLAELETVRASTSTVQVSSRKNDNDDNTPLSDILNRYLESGSSSWIKYSIRPALYTRFGTLAEETGDYRTLIQVGESLASESQWHSHSTPLKARGILYQISGWRGLGQQKKAMALERKHRLLLESDVSMMSTTTETPDEVLECVGASIASWDQRIPQNWSPLLEKWWKTAKDKACWEEEASLWVDSQAAYTR